MWGTQAEIYARAVFAWRSDPSAEHLADAGMELSVLISEFDPYADALRAIHDDPALAAESAWSEIWPSRPAKGRPRLEDTDDVQMGVSLRFTGKKALHFNASITSDFS